MPVVSAAAVCEAADEALRFRHQMNAMPPTTAMRMMAANGG